MEAAQLPSPRSNRGSPRVQPPGRAVGTSRSIEFTPSPTLKLLGAVESSWGDAVGHRKEEETERKREKQEGERERERARFRVVLGVSGVMWWVAVSHRAVTRVSG